MGKKAEKSVSKERQSNTILHTDENVSIKSSEPHKCTGNFLVDFTELCKQKGMTFIPSVIPRHRGVYPVQQVSSDSRLDKKGDKKPAIPHPEHEVDTESRDGVAATAPKTFTTREKLEYFKPNVQAELENSEKWDTVTEIYVRGWKIDEPMMDVFKHCMPAMTKLHTVNFWNTGLTEDTLRTLAAFLPACHNVRNVVLDGNCVKEENWSDLIGENSLIQNLSLRHCKITDKGAAKIGKALGTAASTNTKLVSLNLAGNQIGDEGAEGLAEGLRMNRTLLSLTLSSNNIGDRGAAKISEILSRFPLTHEEVVLRRKLLSEKGLAERKSDTKSKDSKEDSTKSLKKDDMKASNSTDFSKSSVKAKDKKKDKGKGSVTEVDREESLHSLVSSKSDWSSDSADINPLMETTYFMDGQAWIAGNRMLINLNLSRNKIGEVGIEALLKAVQYQTTLTLETKSSGTGLLRLVIDNNAASPGSENVTKLNELMLPKDPFYRPPLVSSSAIL